MLKLPPSKTAKANIFQSTDIEKDKLKYAVFFTAKTHDIPLTSNLPGGLMPSAFDQSPIKSDTNQGAAI
jgi:hypothetical protein